MTQLDIKRIRNSVNQHIGSRVKISANKGRHKFVVAEGVIKETYPSIFLVELVGEEAEKLSNSTVSFSYQDVVTKDVRMVLCN